MLQGQVGQAPQHQQPPAPKVVDAEQATTLDPVRRRRLHPAPFLVLRVLQRIYFVVKLLLQAGAKLPAAPQLNGERIDVQGNAGNCPQLAAFGKKVRTASASAATVKESGAGAKKAG